MWHKGVRWQHGQEGPGWETSLEASNYRTKISNFNQVIYTLCHKHCSQLSVEFGALLNTNEFLYLCVCLLYARHRVLMGSEHFRQAPFPHRKPVIPTCFHHVSVPLCELRRVRDTSNLCGIWYKYSAHIHTPYIIKLFPQLSTPNKVVNLLCVENWGP